MGLGNPRFPRVRVAGYCVLGHVWLQRRSEVCWLHLLVGWLSGLYKPRLEPVSVSWRCWKWCKRLLEDGSVLRQDLLSGDGGVHWLRVWPGKVSRYWGVLLEVSSRDLLHHLWLMVLLVGCIVLCHRHLSRNSTRRRRRKDCMAIYVLLSLLFLALHYPISRGLVLLPLPFPSSSPVL